MNKLVVFILIIVFCVTILTIILVERSLTQSPSETLIYFDDMETLRMRLENEVGTGAIGTVGASSIDGYSVQSSFQNRYVTFIRTAIAEGSSSYGFRALPLPKNLRLAIQFYVTFPFRYVNWADSRHDKFIFKLHIWVGFAWVYYLEIKWMAEDGELLYLDDTSNWQHIANYVSWGEPANLFRLAVDVSSATAQYLSLNINEQTYDLSAVRGTKVATANGPAIDLLFGAYSRIGNYDEILISDLAVYNNIP